MSKSRIIDNILSLYLLEQKMEFSIKAIEPGRTGQDALLSSHHECLIIGLFEDGLLNDVTKVLDRMSGGLLGRLIKSGEVTGKRKTHILLHEVPGVGAARVLLVGLGKAVDFDAQAWTDCARYTLLNLVSTSAHHASWLLPSPQDYDFLGQCVWQCNWYVNSNMIC